jgi:hypothetical protein
MGVRIIRMKKRAYPLSILWQAILSSKEGPAFCGIIFFKFVILHLPEKVVYTFSEYKSGMYTSGSAKTDKTITY